jgi:beta-galactosidase
MKVILLFTIALLSLNNLIGQEFISARENFLLEDFVFYKGDLPLPSVFGKSYVSAKVKWDSIKVPHTWNDKDVPEMGLGSYKGPAWYKSSFNVPKADENRRFFIRFEGVSTFAEVYINEEFVGEHKGGFSAFCFDLTPFLYADKENILAVKVNNTFRRDITPSEAGLYPLFGGIYRPVTIFSTNEICISPLDYASSGVYVSQENVTANSATLNVNTLLSNGTGKENRIKISTTIIDEENNIIEQVVKELIVTDVDTVINQSIDLKNIRLWDAKRDPYMYKLLVKLQQDDKTIDQVIESIGIRSFHIDKNEGLILNDKKYNLYGVCRHQEWLGLGNALTDKNHETDIEFIKEIGANGVRFAHYQQADKMYELCDKNGLVVWAEIPVTPVYLFDNKEYHQNCIQQLNELIKQNYNHPSILFWGLYNEVDIPVKELTDLNNVAKKLDKQRLTTQGDFREFTERHSVPDLVAWNRYDGWYDNNLGEMGNWADSIYITYPDILFGISEFGAGASISQQQENPLRPDPSYGRFFPEQYQNIFHEATWKSIRDKDYIWCKFIWNMFDFNWTQVKRGDKDYMNHKGLVTHDRQTRKDAFYFYKANWSDEPVIYITSRRNIERTKPETAVKVYCNLNKVELYLNGKLVSRKTVTSDIKVVEWESLTLMPGRNQISVIGYGKRGKFTDACTWNYVKQ